MFGAMIKKTKKKSKNVAKKVGKKRVAKEKKIERTPAEVRKQLAQLVIEDAEGIAKAIIAQSKAGQFAPAKYAFEMAHVYPEVNDGSEATENEDCLARTLLKRLNIPETPVVADQDDDGETIPPAGIKGADEAKPQASGAEELEEKEVTVG